MEVLNIGVALANLGILYLTAVQFHLSIPLIILINVAVNLGLVAARFIVPREEGGGNAMSWMFSINIVVLIAGFIILMQRFSFFMSAGILASIGLLFGLLFAGYMYYKLRGIIDVVKKAEYL
jgi:hypothetical protein